MMHATPLSLYLRRAAFALIVLPALALAAVGCPGKPVQHGPLVFMPPNMPNGVIGQAYSVEITAENAATPMFLFEPLDATKLPPGLTFTFSEDSQKATITGTPTQLGSYDFELQALCYGTQVSGQEGKVTYTISIVEPEADDTADEDTAAVEPESADSDTTPTE